MRNRKPMVVLTTLLSSLLMIAGVVSLSSGARAAAVDREFAPQATGAFTGQVTAEDGTTPLSGINVRAYQQTGYDSWTLVATVQTAGDGTYTVTGLDADIYRAKFEDPAGDYVSEYYDDRDTFTFATNFEVADGDTTPDIDAALAQAGHIQGMVTTIADGEPVADIVVTAWYTASGSWQTASGAVSQSDGVYDIGGLPSGSYRVRFSDAYSPPQYLDEVYDNASSLADGTDVPVTAGVTTTGIDAALGQYGSVTGTVYRPDGATPVEGIYADVYAWNATLSTWEWISGDTTDATGAYQAGGLETGDYRVQFSDPVGQYANEVYNDRTSLDTGDDVHVELGSATSDIDAALSFAENPVTLGLAQGWNLISFPVVLDDPTMPSALETISGTASVVWTYDACTIDPDPWLKYDPNDPLSELNAVDTMHGYWIDMTSSAELTVIGTYPISTVISLCTGWNLIGYASANAKPVTETLEPISGQYDLVYGYDGADTADPWKKYNPGVPVGNDLENLTPGYGYWIRMTAPATLTISGR
jgi:hypothetical protein